MKEMPLKTTADYVSAYRTLADAPQGEDRPIRIALLSSFTMNLFKEVLFVQCKQAGIHPSIYMGAYNQIDQEILNPDGALRKFDPELVIVFCDTRGLLGDDLFQFYSLEKKERKNLMKEKEKWVMSLLAQLKKTTKAKILLHNFDVPSATSMGILENKEEFGLTEALETLNAQLRDSAKNEARVYVFDFENFVSGIGKENSVDAKMLYMGDIRLKFDHFPKLSDSYLGYIKPLVGLSRKCLVLDLDNTLWGGILGEDGFDGIQLGPEKEGRSYFEFQKYLLALYHRGVILAINSKNNKDEVLRVLREHPSMVLKEKHFSSLQINWNDKAENMKAIAEELNIGLNSLVFIDDDPINRERVQKAWPEVEVLDWPEDPSLALQTIQSSHAFHTFVLTDEDRKRGKMYAEQRKRNEFKRYTGDLNGFLEGLGMTAKIEPASSFNIARLAQLTQRTNQFNLTTRRYQEENIRSFSENKNKCVFGMTVKDKFGDNGLSGLVILDKENDVCRIEALLMSCRVIGRGLEDVLLAHAVSQAKVMGGQTLLGEYIPSSKNGLVKDFYKKKGFTLAENKEGTEIWQYNLKNSFSPPSYIEVIQNGQQ